MTEKEEIICPSNRGEWRQWLEEHHAKKQSIWLLYYKKKAAKPTLDWSEAVDEALCFGWIDSKRKPVDEEKFIQFFSKRKVRSTWSKVNKEKVLRLTEAGLMTQAGLDSIEAAKQNGSWTLLDEVEELIIPADLDKEFQRHTGSKDFFLSLSKSVRKGMLQWLVLSKQPETRLKRIQELAMLAGQKRKPKQF